MVDICAVYTRVKKKLALVGITLELKSYRLGSVYTTLKWLDIDLV